MNYEILEDNRLRIYLEDADREALRQTASDYGEEFDSDSVMIDVLEWLVCNSELQWSSPERIAALTDAPTLCICGGRGPIEDADKVGYELVGRWYSPQGDICFWGDRILQAWCYMSYAVRSPQRDLLEYGECFWQCGWKVE